MIWRYEEFGTQSQVLSSGYSIHFSVTFRYSPELLFWKTSSHPLEWTSCEQHNSPCYGWKGQVIITQIQCEASNLIFLIRPPASIDDQGLRRWKNFGQRVTHWS